MSSLLYYLLPKDDKEIIIKQRPGKPNGQLSLCLLILIVVLPYEYINQSRSAKPTLWI